MPPSDKTAGGAPDKNAEKKDGTSKGEGSGDSEKAPSGSQPQGNSPAGGGGGDNKPGDKNGDRAQKPTEPNNPAAGGTPPQNQPAGGTPGKNSSDNPKSSGPGSTVGGPPDAKHNSVKPPDPIDTPTDEANLNYARRQTELALEHLRDQLAKEKPHLLDRLGWTKDDARRFIERWEEMKRAAAEPGPRGEAARRQFDDALRSLGLRPRGSELRGGGVAKDRPAKLHYAGRFAPPPEWSEQFRAYTRGVAGGEEKKDGK